MRIAVINGSLKDQTTNTNVMVTAFLKGAQAAGAETVNIFLAEKEIKHWGASHSYWFHYPGQCMTKHDMAEALAIGAGTNIIVITTPVYFENISGMLNAFMDRLTMTGNHYPSKDKPKEDQSLVSPKMQLPKLMMISSCGSPERSETQVISLWIKRMALKMDTEVIAEIYAAQGRFLTEPTEKLRPFILRYLELLEKAGKEIATNMNLSAATKSLLENNMKPII
ncbi:MAG: flavodoxin family protein [Sporomusaceae bacterium]|nr:flavodoxin family protein [Sporomusaceae bacterium]